MTHREVLNIHAGISEGFTLEIVRKPLSISHLSRPALGPTQPPVQWVPGLSRGKERPGRDADPSPSSSAVVKKE